MDREYRITESQLRWLETFDSDAELKELAAQIRQQPTQILPGDKITLNGKEYVFAGESSDDEPLSLYDIPDPDDIDSSKVGP